MYFLTQWFSVLTKLFSGLLYLSIFRCQRGYQRLGVQPRFQRLRLITTHYDMSRIEPQADLVLVHPGHTQDEVVTIDVDDIKGTSLFYPLVLQSNGCLGIDFRSGPLDG